jgi:hypothetical protein
LSEANVGGKNERFREHRIGHFRLQTRRERNRGGRFLGSYSIRGPGEGYFGAPSIHGHDGWCLSPVRWDVRRFGGRKADLES